MRSLLSGTWKIRFLSLIVHSNGQRQLLLHSTRVINWSHEIIDLCYRRGRCHPFRDELIHALHCGDAVKRIFIPLDREFSTSDPQLIAGEWKPQNCSVAKCTWNAMRGRLIVFRRYICHLISFAAFLFSSLPTIRRCVKLFLFFSEQQQFTMPNIVVPDFYGRANNPYHLVVSTWSSFVSGYWFWLWALRS